MAASVAASVVWLTVAEIMTLTPGLFSGAASGLPSDFVELGIDLDSDFLLVTGAFDCADDGLAGACSGLLASVDALTLTLAGTLPADFCAVVPGFAAEVLDGGEARSVSRSVVRLTAGFFIAFAVGLTKDSSLLMHDKSMAKPFPETKNRSNVLNQKLLSIAYGTNFP